MFINITCPKCGNKDERKFSTLGYTNAFKIPFSPNLVCAVVKCENRECQHEFEIIAKSGRTR